MNRTMISVVIPTLDSARTLPVTLANGQVLTAAALSDSVGGVDPELLILDDVSSK